MKIIIVDDNRDDLEALSDMVWELRQDDDIMEFEDPLAALAKAREEEIDIAFIETNMSELSGIDLGRYLKDLNPYINLIYYSQHTKAAYEAMKLHASGYIQKPCTDEDVEDELDSLRYAEVKKRYKRVFAQTFDGNEAKIDMSSFEAGIYMVRISADGNEVTKKISVVK